MNDILKISKALDFAAKKHVNQRRKGVAQEPYINHLAEVSLLLAEATKGKDVNLVIAGLLHDCREDQNVPYEELVEHFGKDVADLVSEVTDDKTLPKPERKRLQVVNTPHKSDRAKMLKLADKTSNLRAIRSSPPHDWDAQRKNEYFAWAKEVVASCGNVNTYLSEQFNEAHKHLGDFGCSKCVQADAELAHEASGEFLEIARLIDESHFIIRIIQCPHCRQSFVSVFAELIDWDDGDDSQSRIILPVTDKEAEAFKAQGEGVDIVQLTALGQGRQSLWWIWPRGSTPAAMWKTGQFFIFPHD